jgi:serine/threonine protein kinase
VTPVTHIRYYPETSPDAERFAPGEVLDGRFRFVEAIGRGGFGEVFRAEELLPDGTAIRQVALKVLSPKSDLGAWAEEAKLLASFSHPSLVTVLAAGLLALRGGVPAPFVAMELLDGETLGDLLDRAGALPWRRVLSWARDVAAALDVIHQRGVVHLDLKPSNLFLTRAGTVKVLDFGIARRAGVAAATSGRTASEADASLGTAEFLAEQRAPGEEERGHSHRVSATSSPAQSGQRIVGTPGFMAPEVIEDRPATPAADAYALAACIVHLATGRLPQDVPHAPPRSAAQPERRAWWDEVRHATSVGRIRDFEAEGGALPRGVAELCRRLLALDPSARGVEPGGLRALLDAAWERPYGVPDPPYLGLGAFGPASEGMLFGRDDDVARLSRDLVKQVVLILQGVSGSGKSSLAMAGVIPALARRDAASGPDWRTVVVRPGVDPEVALESALAGVAPELAHATAAEAAAFAGKRGIGLAFVFDQLEELVTQAGPETRGRFVEFLAAAALLPREAPLRVLGTLREDFTSGLLGIEPLGERLRDALRFVGPPTMAAVRAIVAQPAELAGVRIEGLGEVAADVERELRAGDGRLPLVAVALSAWWRTRTQTDGALQASEWARLGGVRAIFADLADGVFQGLDGAAQSEARAALLELSSDGKTRRSLRRAALRERAGRPDSFDRAMDAFVAGGLLVETGGALEIVHEFLFTAWDRLDGWLADARSSRRLAAALREGAHTWQELGRPATRLPGDSEVVLAQLVLSEGGLEGEDADLVHEWLGAERRRALRTRVRAALIAASVLAVLLIGLGAWGKMVSEAQARVDQSLQKADLAAQEARENQARANEAKADAEKAKADAERARSGQDRAAERARQQQAEFDRLLGEAASETQKAKVRCMVLEKKERIQAGGCPPGDPLCAASEPGTVRLDVGREEKK